MRGTNSTRERPGRDAPAAVRGPVHAYLEALHTRLKSLDGGTVATYIPELGRADPDWFSICVATIDGHVYEVGDSRQPFTLQSMSKPFVYGLALEDRGKPAVLGRIGVEPTGDAFNEISLERRLTAMNGKPHWEMPQLMLAPSEIPELAAYIARR